MPGIISDENGDRHFFFLFPFSVKVQPLFQQPNREPKPAIMSVTHTASAKLPTKFGDFAIHVFADPISSKEHLALVFGDLDPREPVLCRVHSECLTGDALFSLRCDCGSQLHEAMRRVAEQGSGVVFYLRQEGRDIGLGNKIRAYNLQDRGADTVEANLELGFEADARDYAICRDMFAHLGITKLRLMTNNPNKVAALQKQGIEVVERLPLITGETSHNRSYLATKRDKLGHIR
jgi:GTP cyclohydrolase II